MKTNVIYDHISLNSSYNEKYFRQSLYRKSRHSFYVQYFFTEYLAVYEIMCKCREEQYRPQMRVECG
jgi:hypothetical protein